jgi:uncharacterized repeat protein (TIGR03803 family)
MQSKKTRSTAKSIFMIFVVLLLPSVIARAQTQAQKFKVLHTFHGPNGSLPMTQLVRDASGNIYGTTSGGGSGICDGTHDCGTGFKLDKTGKQVWLHNFNGSNGAEPAAGLLLDAAGNLYGTTALGGDMTCFSLGCGTVFKLDKNGKETVLHKFKGSPDGEMPEALLVKDSAGNLYGTTPFGGRSGGYGTVFQLRTTGKETILHSFAGPPDGGADGAYSAAGVIRDAAGNLYGVTNAGGPSGAGVVYGLDAGTETLLYSFPGGSDGDDPFSILVADAAGNLYGTTREGGNSECGGTGCGTVFELSPQSDGGWKETTLYTFCSQSNCSDGEEPIAGPLVRDSDGNLYGTTYFGGSAACGRSGCGVVFKLDTSGKETILHTFTGDADGANPWAGLTMDKAGNLYGAATQGGDLSCPIENGCGVVFRITP